jgi:hypothetical protein
MKIDRTMPKFCHPTILGLLSILLCLAIAQPASAFCGFFVARSEVKLNNSASRVVIVRDGNKSIFTMANNFQGDVQDFARIVPIPVIPKREQVRIGDNQVIDQLDAFTAPRLVKYVDNFDRMLSSDITQVITFAPFLLAMVLAFILSRKLTRMRRWEILLVMVLVSLIAAIAIPSFLNQANKAKSADRPALASESVRVADQFTVGEYDVALLDASESDGLTNWLRTNGYNLPQGSETILNSYIQQGMKFFVVKINLEVLQKSGHGFLRPIVIEYESPKFMLPIRLGTINAQSDQDLTVYVLSNDSVAEAANYPTIPIPTDSISTAQAASGKELPLFIQNNFGEFYQSVFQKIHENSGKSAVLMEFAGLLGRCDPCSMPVQEIEALLENLPKTGIDRNLQPPVTITRLHVRYNQQTFPKDLEFRLVNFNEMRSRFYGQTPTPMQRQVLKRTGTLLQGRYVIRDTQGGAWSLSRLKYHWQMRNTNANLASLTGWSQTKIQQQAQVFRTKHASK